MAPTTAIDPSGDAFECGECGAPLYSTDNGVHLECLNSSCERYGRLCISAAWADIFDVDDYYNDYDRLP